MTDDKPRCPLVNPLCPDDLCVLPAGHKWTRGRRHLLGTMYGSVPDPDYPNENLTKYVQQVSKVMYLAPVGTPEEELIRLGWARSKKLWPEMMPP